VQDLLTVPGGCPEQTLSRLAPVIILTGYLDATGQWGKVGVEHRDQVIKNIISGESGDPRGGFWLACLFVETESHYVGQAGLKVVILLPPPPG
jgi:hypothetical protein